MALALTLALLAAPAAFAARPFMTVFGPPDPVVIPAGQGCAFDVLEAVDLDDHARGLYFAYSNGREVIHANGNAKLTNVATGDSYLHHARFFITTSYLSDEVIRDSVDGSMFINFLPGDEGPFGEVSAPGAMYRFTGHLEYTFDLVANAYTDFAWNGTLIDLCAELSD